MDFTQEKRRVELLEQTYNRLCQERCDVTKLLEGLDHDRTQLIAERRLSGTAEELRKALHSMLFQNTAQIIATNELYDLVDSEVTAAYQIYSEAESKLRAKKKAAGNAN